MVTLVAFLRSTEIQISRSNWDSYGVFFFVWTVAMLLTVPQGNALIKVS